MSKRRPAHTVTLVLHRFDVAEHADQVDPMELIGLHDELSRIERKWRTQIAEGSERRKPESDIQKLNDWFARLNRLIERALRAKLDEPTRSALEKLGTSINERSASV